MIMDLVLKKINPTLTIYTKNYILYRHEYDGAECFLSVPTKENILSQERVKADKNVIYADTYYGRTDYCWNEGYE